jgi:dipeptidyl aminopeptidase/acylaminoacyl peptidase
MKKIAEDILSSVRYLQARPDVDGTRICVVGHSIGGAGGILAASLEPRIRALVSISAFADPDILTRRHMRAAHIPRWPFLWLVRRFIESWLDTTMADVAPKNRIGRVEAPVLLVHGDSDKFIPSTDMDIIYGKSNEEKTQRWLVSARRHSDVFLDPGFGPRVVDFLLASSGR